MQISLHVELLAMYGLALLAGAAAAAVVKLVFRHGIRALTQLR
jgi:hypothetical protein